MKANDLYRNKKSALSFEFFPYRDAASAKSFAETIGVLAPLKPDYMSVTFGAGGSTCDGSYQTVRQLVKDHGQPTVAYIAGYGLAPEAIIQVLDRYRDLGIQTIFVLRGDQPKEADFAAHPDSFTYASDLIAFIKKNYSFTLGCAGYPEGHLECQSPEKNLDYLKQKVDNGAEYVVTQYFYDNDFFFRYVDQCRKAGIQVPIIPGVMPVYTLKMTQNLAKVCGSSIPPFLQARMDAVDASDKQAVLDLGADFATQQCRGLLKTGIAGLHIYTMDRSYTTAKIVNTLRSENLL
ncbi:methylenetetrahydrofolate reductase [Holophaga foetida]|uniref:methylenetetrahydrofolate reductase n=1 Tax=Holophaga foetida TaxID=35839 RepID=UPI0002475032|nr:methylenetetrahydrofolate reductase [Holophaga foetida]